MNKFFLLIVLALFTNPVFAQDYNVFRLKNGHTVVIKEVKTNPVVTIDTWIKTGSTNETNENNGVSHFLEHLFFKGSKNYAPGEFDKTLETKGAITNAATSKDYTHYYITIPSKEFDLALQMHADMLLNPLIPRKELEKERKIVIEEIMRNANEPNRVAIENLTSLLYTNHPYKYGVLGTKEIINTIQRDDILDYYNKFYNPSNMITVIIGDIDSEETLAKVKQQFKSEYKEITKINKPKEKPLKSQKRSIKHFPVETGYIFIGFRTTELDNKDTYALNVLSVILGEGRSSVFYKNIKDEKKLADTIKTYNIAYKDDGIFYIYATCQPKNSDELEKNIFDEIENIKTNGVSQEQLNIAKNIIERNKFYNEESVTNIAEQIGYAFVMTNNTDFYKTYLDNIKKVTANDIKRIANKYLAKEKSAVSILLPEKNKEIKISDKTDSNKKADLISTNNTTQKYRLPNGSILLYTPNTLNNIIAINITAKGGILAEKVPGTSSVLASCLLEGTKNFSQTELAKYIEKNGIKLKITTSTDKFTIDTLTTKNEFDKTFVVLNEIINNATLSNFDIEKVKNEKLNLIKKNNDVPLNIAIDNYKSLIFENSPYITSNKITEQYIPGITQNDILEYYKNIFTPENIVISVNGNIEKEKLIKNLSPIFNKNKGEKFNYNNFSVQKLNSQKTIIHKTNGLKTTWIVAGWQVGGTSELKEYATLQVIDSLLGTGMSSRLFKNLRDKDGLAYQLGSQYIPNILKGAFIVYIGTNPESYDYAQKRLFEEVFRLKNEFVGSKELQEAKDKLLGHYIIGQETNLDKAKTIGWFEASGRGYEFDKQYTNLINSVTESDIIEVANKYFNGNFVLSIVKPE